MTHLKSYTSLEQSKELSKILPLESADMHYGEYCVSGENYPVPNCDDDYNGHCCWSLAALLGILAKIASKIDDDGSADLSSFMGQWSINMFDCPVETTDNYDNPVDACYEMILKLHELKML